MEYLEVKHLKAVLKNVPDDAKVYYERIHDEYFDKHGWKAEPLADDPWWERVFEEQTGEEGEGNPGEWIRAYEAFYNKKENVLKITAHF